jgi:hypothetical protein
MMIPFPTRRRLLQARFAMHVLSVAVREQLSHMGCELGCMHDLLVAAAAETPLGCTSKD